MKKYVNVDIELVKSKFRPIEKKAHKGIQGHALIIGGSYGKIGSVSLSSKACLKSGAGLVTAYIPKCGYDIIQVLNPEVMVITDECHDYITSVYHNLSIQSIGIGMGMGVHKETQQAFLQFLKMNDLPMVIDADGLNILSENKSWLENLASKAVLTPHRKELERLIGNWSTEEEMIEKVKSFSNDYDIVIVVKGAPTMIVYKTMVYINSTGNQALATAGSGDVLTGIITGLLAQGYEEVDASILGVYLHGLTADLAVPETGCNSFTASDIIHYLGKAFLTLEK
ncbi:NAD(P)H-hydrate dehydratase [Flavobacterium terrae]|uniref:ADP-dependent (S)-NAD(P)H-hydrate dehydratase n=1 Tax=Flavobacterium terrae TaxID=415425 RepID=A0A1M6EP14_9FLAO|nr:NAD(P)H-hydrate dehydratase [Flavobacterium terrae]SHI87221.1 yjeF C-terminal region, hydroxyethylthiazole kinase-related [Flavobacterium terrae]